MIPFALPGQKNHPQAALFTTFYASHFGNLAKKVAQTILFVACQKYCSVVLQTPQNKQQELYNPQLQCARIKLQFAVCFVEPHGTRHRLQGKQQAAQCGSCREKIFLQSLLPTAASEKKKENIPTAWRQLAPDVVRRRQAPSRRPARGTTAPPLPPRLPPPRPAPPN